MKGRTLQVSFLAFMLIVACNKEDFYGTSVEIQGADAACSAGVDVKSCEALQDCQVALEDVESVEPVFASCISDPPPEVVIDPLPKDDEEKEDEKEDEKEEVKEEEEEEKEPTIKEAYEANIENLDEKYLLIKEYSGKGKSQRVKKVKVCHKTSSGEHAIIVACPALKAHNNHEDYLGACKD